MNKKEVLEVMYGKRANYVKISKKISEPNRYKTCINCGDKIGVNDYKSHVLVCGCQDNGCQYE